MTTAPAPAATTTAPTAPTDGTPAGESTTTTTDTGDEGTDLASEVEKWKNLARKHEDRAKQNAGAARELEQLRQQSMTDQEKAVAAARNEGRAEALREAAMALVDAEVKIAANGRQTDVESLLEGLDRTRFIDDDGRPKTDAIKAWVEKVAPAAETTGAPPAFDLGQGARGRQSMPLNGDPLERALKDAVGVR